MQLGIQRQLVAVGVQQILELREGKIVLPAAAPQAGKVYVVDPAASSCRVAAPVQMQLTAAASALLSRKYPWMNRGEGRMMKGA